MLSTGSAAHLPDKTVVSTFSANLELMSWYPIRFADESTFSHSARDIKTYAMAQHARAPVR